MKVSSVKNRESFDYSVSQTSIKIIREPGPTKILDPKPVALEDMSTLIKASNDWKTSPVLKEIQIFGYIDGAATSLNNNVLKQHLKDNKHVQKLTESEMEYWVTECFGIDKSLYHKALGIYKKNRNEMSEII